MKKISYLLSVMILLCASCKKDNLQNNKPAINYSDYKLKSVITRYSNYSDTNNYTYSSNQVSMRTSYSNTSSISIRNFTKYSGNITQEILTNNIKEYDGYFRLNNKGNIDSAILIRTNGVINSNNAYRYNDHGDIIQERLDFITYNYNTKKYYQNNNYSYFISEFKNISNPSQNREDSIVYEYYADKIYHLPYKGQLTELYGNPQKNLVKKRNYYNNLTKVFYQSFEYEYETDEIGLVKKEIWNIYSQPGNVLQRTDTSYMSYIKQ